MSNVNFVKNKWRLAAVALTVTLIVLSSFVALYQVPYGTSQTPAFLEVSIVGPDKLGANTPTTFTASVANSYSDKLEYTWSISPQDDKTVLESDGASCTLTFVVATEEPYVLSVQAKDLVVGNLGSASKTVHDPYTSPNLYLGAYGAPYSYLIETDGLGWYRAINGSTGRVEWSSTNADTVINLAINGSGANSHIKINPGLYVCPDEIILRYNNTILEGSGEGTILQPTSDIIGANATLIHDIGVADPTIFLSHVTIKNLAIDGNGITMSHGVWLRKAYDSSFENIFIYDFTNNGASGYKGGALDLGADTYRCQIINCKSENCYAEEGDFHSSGWETTITDCRSYNSLWGGIYTPRAGGGVVSDNIIYNPTKYGIVMEGPVSIVGNEVHNATIYGIYVYNKAEMVGGTIANNIIRYSGNDGIRIEKGNVTVTGNYITRNGQITTTSGGIRINGASYCIIANNQIYEDAAFKKQVYGIFETGASDYNLIVNNNLSPNKNYPVQSLVGLHTILRGNLGFNNASVLSTPISGSTYNLVAVGTNSTWVSGATYTVCQLDMVIYLNGGTSPTVAVNGVTIASGAALNGLTIDAPVGTTFAITDASSMPTITVIGK